MGCCQNCAPITSFRLAFSSLEDVKWAPTVHSSGKPTFVEKFVYWRGCCLWLCCMVGVIYIILSSKKMIEDFVDVQKKMTEFPEFVRRYIGMFLWADFGAECLQEIITFAGIIMLMRVYCDRENFKRSSGSLRTTWLVLTAGPFVVFVAFPLVFAFRSDILRRDLCAVTTGVFVRDHLTGQVFAQAANLAGEVKLATAAGSGASAFFGKPGYESAPLTQWCYSHSMDWAERLFSRPWVQSAVGSLSDGTTIKAPSFKSYPGVIPKAFELVITTMGIPDADDYAFCNDKKYSLSGSDLAGMKLGSLLQQDELHDEAPLGYASILAEMFGIQGMFGPLVASEKASQASQGQLEAERGDRFASFSPRGLHRTQNDPSHSIVVQAQGDVDPAPRTLMRHEHHGRTPHARDHHAIAPESDLGSNAMLKSEENAWKSWKQSHHAGDEIGFDGALSQTKLHDLDQERLAARHDLLEYPAYAASHALSQETKVDSQGHASQNPVTVGLASKLGLNSICAAKQLAMAYAKVAAFADMSTKLMLGLYCAVANSLPMFSLVVGVIDGVGAGTLNVKKVLKKSSLPGYLMMLTIIVTLPAFLFILTFLSQLGGHPLFSAAMLCLGIWRAMDLRLALAQIEEKNSKKLKKVEESVAKSKKIAQIFAGLFIVAFTVYNMFQTKLSVGVDASAISEQFIHQMKQVGAMGIMITKFVFTRVSTKLITTNYVLECIFDTADDSLKASGEDSDEVEKAFQKLLGKKSKKKKHDNEEEQQGEDAAGPSEPGAEPGAEPASEPPAQDGESSHKGEQSHDDKHHHHHDHGESDGDEDKHKKKKKDKKHKKSKS